MTDAAKVTTRQKPMSRTRVLAAYPKKHPLTLAIWAALGFVA